MVQDLSIWKIKINSLKYNDDYNLSVYSNPAIFKINANGSFIINECKPEFLEILEFQGNKIDILMTSSKATIMEDDVQCFAICDLDGNYFALADLSLTKFFLLDSGIICSKEECMQAAKAKKRQQLYNSLASHLNQAMKAQKELEELEEISLNLQEK